MRTSTLLRTGLSAAALMLCAHPAFAQLLKAQCPTGTYLHPATSTSVTVCDQYRTRNGVRTCVRSHVETRLTPNDGIKCQEISGGDGYATMADGNQTYLFGFGPLSGLDLISQGLPGTQTAANFLDAYNMPSFPGLNGGAAVADPTHNSKVPDSPNGGVLDAAEMMNVGVLAAQQPAPLIAINEDEELFLTLSNVGMIMRPDLFEQHTVHFHGYPNASSYFDGVPDASVAISISGSMTYYYLAPDAGTYFWHCHITPPEHLQMGMVGQLFVRPRQNQVTGDLGQALFAANKLHAAGASDGIHCTDILCTGQTPLPAGANATDGTSNVARDTAVLPATVPTTGDTPHDAALRAQGLTHEVNYAYNDGDGSTAYDVEYPLQLMGFDPRFHFVGMTFNPEDFSGMKDKYFLISGRGYPDTISSDDIRTQASDGLERPSQPVRSLITLQSCASAGGGCAGKVHRALLRVSDLNVTEFHTLASNLPMTVIGYNARLLRDLAGNNMYYDTNSITLGGGESADLILKSDDVPPGTYFLYTTNLDHLANDAENVGGMMTEIIVQ